MTPIQTRNVVATLLSSVNDYVGKHPFVSPGVIPAVSFLEPKWLKGKKAAPARGQS